MTTISEVFQTAVGHHQAGRLDEAAKIYRQILIQQPRHAEAMQLLGVIAHQSKQSDEAIRLMSNAIRIEGNKAYFHSNLGEVFRSLGRLADAKSCYEKALRLEPNFPQACYNLAVVLYRLGDVPQAIERCRQALALKADYFEAHGDLGNMLRESGDLAGAEASYRRAVELNPKFFDARVNLATLLFRREKYDESEQQLLRALEIRPGATDVLIYLGELETARDQRPKAIEWYQRALQVDPKLARAEVLLGAVLQTEGLHDAAIGHYRRAIELQFNAAATHHNLATALEAVGRPEEAFAEYETAVRIDPNYLPSHINLGAYWQEHDDPERALRHYDHVLAQQPAFAEAHYNRAIALQSRTSGAAPEQVLPHIDRAIEDRPSSAEAHFNRALILLSRGDFAAAWPEYEWRKKLPSFPMHAMQEPVWDGSELGDKTLLVHAEQGMGDTLQFIRYVPLVQRRCPRIVVHVQQPLVRLLTQSGFNVVGFDDPLPPFDVQVPMLTVPGIVDPTFEHIPAQVPYLSAGQERVELWRARLADVAGLRVGICWQGNLNHKSDRVRSIPLRAFEPLARVKGLRLVSLQKREGLEQLAELKEPFAIHELGDDWDAAAGAFVDTAAVMQHLDLVIAADTSIAHLAGALGVPVWLALCARPDWRWTLGGNETPWYPTMRLLRQAKVDDWSSVFESMVGPLTEMVAAKVR